MNTFKTFLWWLTVNYIQLVVIAFLIFFFAQIMRLIFNF